MGVVLEAERAERDRQCTAMEGELIALASAEASRSSALETARKELETARKELETARVELETA